MYHTRSPLLDTLAVASQLTPPPSPDNHLEPVEDGNYGCERGTHKLPQLLSLPDAANSNRSAHSSNALSPSRGFFDTTTEKDLESGISAAQLSVQIVEPVSPLSSTHSDRGTSFDVSRPASFLSDYASTATEAYNSTSAVPQCDVLPPKPTGVTLSAPRRLTPAGVIQTHLSSKRPNDTHSTQWPRPLDAPVDNAPKSTIEQNGSLPRPNMVRQYEKELPPPPSNTELSETSRSSHANSSEISSSNLNYSPGFERKLYSAGSLSKSGYERPNSRWLNNSSLVPSHRETTPQQTPISSAFSGVAASLHTVQPTYTVTVTAPKLTRRFSKLSTKSKESSNITDPLAPVSIIPQKSNGVETGTIAYLPRYTNTFAGFCKNAWRLQIGEVDKALNVRNRHSSSVAPSFKCKKCAFEGSLQPGFPSGSRFGSRQQITDTRVRTSYGVAYTWQFLFKSHVALNKQARKKFNIEDSEGLFACIFCCAKGNGTPVFLGSEALMWHMRSHTWEREMFDKELEMRFKVIIGRSLEEGDVFDVFIPPLGDSAADKETK